MKIVIAVVFCLLPASWQIPASGKVVIRSSSRAVQLTVLAEDKAGRPVLNLKQEDFILLDEGKPQEIQVFLAPAERQARLEAARASSPAPDAGTADVPVQSTKTARNSNGHTVILLDLNNIPRRQVPKSMDQVQRFMDQLEEGQDVTLFIMGKQLYHLDHLRSKENRMAVWRAGVRPMSTLWNDPDTLEDLSKTIRTIGLPTEAGANLITSVLIEDQYFEDRRVEDSLRIMQALAKQLAGIPGPKNLIWVSAGFSFTSYEYSWKSLTCAPVSRSLEPAWQATVKELNQSDVSVHTVDARGLRVDGLIQDDNVDTLRVMARRTGGKMFTNTNDLHGVMRSVVERSAGAYEMAYAPDHGKWDGKYRRIALKCKAPGISLRCREGYFAARELMLDQDEIRKIMIQNALSPLSAASLGFSAETAARIGDRPGLKLQMRFRVNRRDLRFENAGDEQRAMLDVLIVPVDSEFDPSGVIQQTAEICLPAGQTFEAMRDKTGFSQEYLLPIRTAAVRIVLRDRASGKIGSVTVPLEETASPELAVRPQKLP